MTNSMFEWPTAEYRVQRDLLVRFKTHHFSLLNSYNFPIYRFKHGFQRSATYLVFYKRPSDGTFHGFSQSPWTGRSWIHRVFFLSQDEQIYLAIKNMRTSIPGVAAVLGALYIVVVPGGDQIPPCIVSAKCALRLKFDSLASITTMKLVGTELRPIWTTLRSSGPSILGGRLLLSSRKRQSPTCRNFPITSIPLSGLNIWRISCSATMRFVTDLWYMLSRTLLRYQMKHMIYYS